MIEIQHQTNQTAVRYFRFDTFPQTLSHGVLSRHGGVSQPPHASLNMSTYRPDDPNHVRENQMRGYAAFDRTADSLVHAQLVHKADVQVVSQANHGRVIPECDALITNEIGCGLTMNYADCAPIFIYDPQNHAIGLGHAGWQGTVQDVPGAMVRAMQAAFGSDPAQLLGGVGPCISTAVYEVGQNVIEAVTHAFPQQADTLLISQKNGPRPHFDLPRANLLNFQRAGVNQVELSGLCTGSRTDLFFSHRAEKGATGRFAAVIVLEEKI